MIYEEIQIDNHKPTIKATDKSGKVYWIPKDEGNSDYQRYLRWLNGEEENGTIS